MIRFSRHLERLFNGLFEHSYNTVLVGGADEPFYRPGQGGKPNELIYRDDYFSSALHEIAHWCIAGPERRLKPDFGYWYYPDGRSLAQQRAFEAVEIKPQALEWIFSTAAGIRFAVSADNLSSEDPRARGPSREFLTAVERQTVEYCRLGLPSRPARFAEAVAAFYGQDNPLDSSFYSGRYTNSEAVPGECCLVAGVA